MSRGILYDAVGAGYYDFVVSVLLRHMNLDDILSAIKDEIAYREKHYYNMQDLLEREDFTCDAVINYRMKLEQVLALISKYKGRKRQEVDGRAE